MSWNLFKKTTPVVDQFKEVFEELGEEHSVAMDFDRTVADIQKLTRNGQVTLMYRLVGMLPHGVVKTLSGYVSNRLNGKAIDKRQDMRYPDRNTQRDNRWQS